MKTESGPHKYRLARKKIGYASSTPIYEYFLLGCFHIDEVDNDGFRVHRNEWRTLETEELK